MKNLIYILPFLWISVFGQKQSLMSHDQYYRICDDEQNNDIIGVWHTYANDTAFSAKSYTHTIISGNGSGIFEIDTDTLKISDNTSLSAGDYYLGIQTTDETRTETNYANIIVDNSSNCIYFDIDNTDPSEDGTRTHPYDAYADVSWISGKYYRTKRGNSSTSTISTNSLSNISWGAWGSSGDKPLLNTSSGSNHCFYFGNTNYHDSLFIYDYRCYGNTTNQPLKFDDSTFYCQIHRIETKNGTTNGAIYFDKIDSNDLSYNKIYDLITDSSGYQGLKHASGGDTILNYISLRAGYGSGAGYGLTMAYTKNTYVYGLYIDKRGGPNGDGGSKGIDYNTGWNKMENVFIRGSFWIGLNISSQNWVCCDSNIINDIYIDLNDNTYTSNYGILLSDSTGPDKDGRNRYNTFSRFHIENVFKGIDIAQRSKYNNFNYFLINNASNDAVENDGVNSEFHNITSYNNGGNEFDFNASSDLSNSFYTTITGTNSGSNNYDLDGGDPFTNAAGGDFTLSSDTLGTDLGYILDIRGFTIENTPSIGAYEYGADEPVPEIPCPSIVCTDTIQLDTFICNYLGIGVNTTYGYIYGLQTGNYFSNYINFNTPIDHIEYSIAVNTGYEGDTLEIRDGSPTGTILKLLITIESTGGWQTFSEYTDAFDNIGGIKEIYFVSKNDDWGNIDWIRFYNQDISNKLPYTLKKTQKIPYATDTQKSFIIR